jgi:hypothetical protein
MNTVIRIVLMFGLTIKYLIGKNILVSSVIAIIPTFFYLISNVEIFTHGIV